MRVVLDANVLVSGLLSPHGPPATIVDLVSAGAHRLCFDGRILAEFRDVLTQPRSPCHPRASKRCSRDSRLVSSGGRLTVQPLNTKLPDPGDQPFLEVAVAAQADFLISGNRKHLPAECRRGVAVVNPREFLEAICE